MAGYDSIIKIRCQIHEPDVGRKDHGRRRENAPTCPIVHGSMKLCPVRGQAYQASSIECSAGMNRAARVNQAVRTSGPLDPKDLGRAKMVRTALEGAFPVRVAAGSRGLLAGVGIASRVTAQLAPGMGCRRGLQVSR
jgi:hypothetical protein